VPEIGETEKTMTLVVKKLLPCLAALGFLFGGWGQTGMFLPLGVSIASATTIYDLVADWSDAGNPNGVWTYREGIDALPSVADWFFFNNGAAVQPAWSPSTNGGNFLPAWFKSTTNNPEGMDFLTGDVVVHSTDFLNGASSGVANVIWTSPINGEIDISGAVWIARNIGRSNTWTLLRNGVSLTSGNIFSGDVFDRANPFDFANGSGGPTALNGIAVSIGDVIELRIEQGPVFGFGDFVGVNLTITTISTCGDGVVNGAEQCDLGSANGAGSCCTASCTVATDGSSCNDGNACTQADTCQEGLCTGNNPVVCTAPDQCFAAGICDPGTGQCSIVLQPDGFACTDGDACTQADSCQAGVCGAGSPVICMALDQCHVAGSCDPASGYCSNPNAANGTACSDDNACTQSDSCQTGMCVGSNPVICTALDQCHVAGICAPATGVCSNPNTANGTACGSPDNTACTAPDSCNEGVCLANHQPDGTICGDAASACINQDTCLVGACTDNGFQSCSQVTSSSLCPIPDDTFRLIYLQDPVLVNNVYNYNNSRLNASNPGQFYYNVFYTEESFPLTIDIPYPFVTQGSVPIQVHSTTPPPDGACWNLGSSWSNCTIATAGSTASGIFSPSGAPIIRLDDYNPKNIDSITQITVNCTAVPASAVYVSVHLDYGLKKTTGWQQLDSPLDVDIVVNDAVNGPVTVLDGQDYTFSFSDGAPVDAHMVFSNNAFKKNPGVAGLTLQTGSANPKANIFVQLLNSSGGVVGTATTDADGFYQIFYKHTGKATNFTVILPSLKIKQTVQLKANGFAAVLFENLP